MPDLAGVRDGKIKIWDPRNIPDPFYSFTRLFQLFFVVTFYMGIFLGLTLLASSPAEASDVLWLMWNGTLPATGKSSLPCLEIFVV
jgi:hypothetical protein